MENKKKNILIVIGVIILLSVSFGGGYLLRNAMWTICPECEKCEDKQTDIRVGTIVNIDTTLKHNVYFDFDILDELDTSVASVDLAIRGKYLLVVDGETIWFDDFNGYAMYHNKIVKLSDETLEKIAVVIPSQNEECCSCCPDLKEGENCITLCCACAK